MKKLTLILITTMALVAQNNNNNNLLGDLEKARLEVKASQKQYTMCVINTHSECTEVKREYSSATVEFAKLQQQLKDVINGINKQ